MLALAAWFFVNRRADPVLVAVSVFDNETGIAEYDRPIAGLSDLVVANLANLAPGRLAVIGNADVLRRPRNIRNLKAVRGNLVFFPTGVPSAKIAFAREGAKITQLTVADPNGMLTARRE